MGVFEHPNTSYRYALKGVAETIDPVQRANFLLDNPDDVVQNKYCVDTFPRLSYAATLKLVESNLFYPSVVYNGVLCDDKGYFSDMRLLNFIYLLDNESRIKVLVSLITRQKKYSTIQNAVRVLNTSLKVRTKLMSELSNDPLVGSIITESCKSYGDDLKLLKGYERTLWNPHFQDLLFRQNSELLDLEKRYYTYVFTGNQKKQTLMEFVSLLGTHDVNGLNLNMCFHSADIKSLTQAELANSSPKVKLPLANIPEAEVVSTSWGVTNSNSCVVSAASPPSPPSPASTASPASPASHSEGIIFCPLKSTNAKVVLQPITNKMWRKVTAKNKSVKFQKAWVSEWGGGGGGGGGGGRGRGRGVKTWPINPPTKQPREMLTVSDIEGEHSGIDVHKASMDAEKETQNGREMTASYSKVVCGGDSVLHYFPSLGKSPLKTEMSKELDANEFATLMHQRKRGEVISPATEALFTSFSTVVKIGVKPDSGTEKVDEDKGRDLCFRSGSQTSFSE